MSLYIMRKAYLKCQKIGGGRLEEECIVSIELADGSQALGLMDEEYFTEDGRLEVIYVGEIDEKITVILPQSLNIGESIEVNPQTIMETI